MTRSRLLAESRRLDRSHRSAISAVDACGNAGHNFEAQPSCAPPPVHRFCDASVCFVLFAKLRALLAPM